MADPKYWSCGVLQLCSSEKSQDVYRLNQWQVDLVLKELGSVLA